MDVLNLLPLSISRETFCGVIKTESSYVIHYLLIEANMFGYLGSRTCNHVE